MSSVDTRVVEMRFDNSQFESGISASMSSLQKLKASLDMKSSEKSLQSLEKVSNKFSLAGISESVEKLNKKFSTFGIIGMTAVSNVTNNAINGVRNLTNTVVGLVKTGGINRALNIENAKFQLQGLGVAWDSISEDINYGVQDTAYGLDAAAKVAAQLVASGVQVGDVMKSDLRAISGVAAMTNSSYEEIGQIFTTISGNGRLMSEQLLQFSSRGLNVAAALATQLGKTESEIRTMVSKGEIDFQTFATAMDNAFGDHAKEANSTFTGALSNMKAALSRIGADFATPIMEQLRKVMTSVTPVINTIRSELAPAVESITERTRIATNMVRILLDNLDLPSVISNVKSFVNSIKPSASTMDKVKRSLNGVVAVVDILGEIVKAILPPALEALGFTVDTVGGTILDITATVGDMLSTFRDWVLENQVVEKTFGLVGEGISDVITFVKKAIKQAKESEFITTTLETVCDTFTDIFNVISGKAPDAANGLNKFTTAIENLLTNKSIGNTANSVKEIKDSIVALSDGAKETSKEVTSATSKDIPKLKASFSGITAAISTFIAKAKEFVTFGNAAKLITIAIGVVMVKFGVAVTNFVKKITEMQTPFQALTSLIKQLKLSVVELQKSMSKKIESGAFKNFAESILMLVGAIAILALLPDKSAINDALLTIGLLAVVMTACIKTLTGAKAAQVSLMGIAAVFLSLAVSIAILGNTLKTLSDITQSWNSLLDGFSSVLSLVGIAAVLVAFTKAISTAAADLDKSVLLLIPVTAAIWIFAVGLEKLGNLKIDNAVGFAISIIAFLGYMKIVATMSTWVNGGVAATLLAMVGSLWIFASSIKKLAKISLKDVLKSIPAMIEAIVGIRLIMTALSGAEGGSLKAGATLLAMAAAIDLMVVAIKAFSRMSLGEVLTAGAMMTPILALFSAVIAVTSIAGENAAKAGVTLLAMAVAIDLMAVAIALLSALDPKGVAIATVCVDSMMAFCAVLIASTHLVGSATKTITMLTIMLGALTVCLALLTFVDNTSLLAATAALDLTMLSLAAVFATIGLMESPSLKALAAMGIMMGVLAEITVAFMLLSSLNNASDLLKISEAISLLMISMAGTMTIAAGIGLIGTAASEGLVTLMGVIALVGSIMWAIGDILNDFDLTDHVLAGLDTAIAILEKIGTGIGGAVGSIVDGFLSTATQNLTTVGTNLSAFASSIMDFINVINSIDTGAVQSVVNLVDIVKNIKDLNDRASELALSNRAGATNNLSSAFAAIGDALIEFSDKVKTLNVSRVSDAAEATKYLTEVLNNMSKENGLVQKIFGGNDFSQLGKPLKAYGEALGEFNDVVTNEDFNVSAIESAAKASSALVELVNELPSTGGWIQDTFGSYDLEGFGAQLYSYTKWLCAVSNYLKKQGMDQASYDAITQAHDATVPLIELANSLQNTGGILQFFTGEPDFVSFGSGLYSWCKWLIGISNLLSGKDIDYDAIENARLCTEKLIALAGSLSNTGGVAQFFTGEKDFSTFGENFDSYGQALTAYSDSVKSVNYSAVDSSITTSYKFIELFDKIGDNYSISGFTSSINTLGSYLKNYAKYIKNVDDDKIIKSTESTRKLVYLANYVSKYAPEDVFTSIGKGFVNFGKSLNNFYKKIKGINETKFQSLANSFSSLSKVINTLKNIDNNGLLRISSAFTTLGETSVSMFTNKIDEGSVDAVKSIGNFMDAALAKIESYKTQFSTSATFVINGFTNGVKGNQLAIQNAGTTVGRNFLNALNAALDINSPSKETEETATWAIKGILKGVKKNTNDVEDAGEDVGESFGDSVSTSMNLSLKGTSKSTDSLESAVEAAGDAVKGVGSSVTSSVKDTWNNVATTTKKSSTGIGTSVVNAFSDWYNKAKNYDISDAVSDAVSSATSAATSAIASSTDTTTKATTSSVASTASTTAKVAKVEYEKVGRIIANGLNMGVNATKIKYTTDQLKEMGTETIKAVQKSLKSSSSIFSDFYEATDDTSSQTKATMAEAANAFISFRDSVKESLESATGVFDEFSTDTTITAEQILKNMKSQISGISAYATSIHNLAVRGLNKNLLKEITDMGATTGSAYASALLSMSNKQLKTVNKLYKKRKNQNKKFADWIATDFVTELNKELTVQTSKVDTKAYVKAGKIIGRALGSGADDEALTKVRGVKIASKVQELLKSSSSIFSEYYTQVNESGDQTKATLEEAAKAFGNFRDAVKESLVSATSDFEAFSTSETVSASTIKENLDSQTTALENYGNNMTLLAERGVSQEVLDYIIGLGVKDGSAYAQGLAIASDEEIKAIEQSYKDRTKAQKEAADKVAYAAAYTGEVVSFAEEESTKTIVEKQKESATKINEALSGTATYTVKKFSELSSKIQKAAMLEYDLSDTKGLYVLTNSLGELAIVTEGQLPTALSTLDTLVDDIFDSMSYGGSVAKKYAETMNDVSDDTHLTTTAANSAKTAVEGLAEALYLSTDEGKAASEELQTLKDNVKKADDQIDYYQKKRDSYTDKNSAEWKRYNALMQEAQTQRESYYQEELDYLENTYTPGVQSAFEDVYNSLVDTFDNLFDPLQASCDSGLDIFKNFTGEIEATEDEAGQTAAEALVSAMQANVTSYQEWQSNLSGLEGMVSDSFYKYIKNLGYSGAEYVSALASMSQEQLSQADAAFAESTKITSETFLENFKERYNKAQEYAEKIQTLSDQGYDISFLKSVVGDLDSDTIDAILNMSDTEREEFQKMLTEIANGKAIDIADAITAVITGAYTKNEAADAAEEAAAGAGEEVKDELDKVANSTEATGADIDTNLAVGITSEEELLQKTAEEASEVTKEGLESKLNKQSGESIGTNTIRGLVDGIRSGKSDVISAAVDVAVSAYAAACASLAINSPSKKFEQIGKYVDMGFANGITGFAKLVTSSATNMSDAVLESVQDSATKIQQAMDSDTSSSGLHITPIFDMSNAKAQASGINAMLSSVMAADVNTVMTQSQTDRMMNQQLSKDISNLSAAIANVQTSLDDGSISNMNQLMEDYFPMFSEGFTLDGQKVSKTVDSNITHNAIRRSKVW